MTDLDHASSNPLEKAKAVSTIVATVVIPLAIALSGNWYGQLQKDKEVQLKYIELSVNILSDPPSESNQAVRGWAIDTINKYSEVKIDSETRGQLLKQQIRAIEQLGEMASEVASKMNAIQ